MNQIPLNDYGAPDPPAKPEAIVIEPTGRTPDITRVAAYVRVSSDSEGQHILSRRQGAQRRLPRSASGESADSAGGERRGEGDADEGARRRPQHRLLPLPDLRAETLFGLPIAQIDDGCWEETNVLLRAVETGADWYERVLHEKARIVRCMLDMDRTPDTEVGLWEGK